MERELARPGVQHGSDAELGADPRRVAAELEQGRACGVEEQIVDELRISACERSELGGQREDDVEVVDRQDARLAALDPRAWLKPWHLGQCRLRHELYDGRS